MTDGKEENKTSQWKTNEKLRGDKSARENKEEKRTVHERNSNVSKE